MISRFSGARLGAEVIDTYAFDASQLRINKIKAADLPEWLHRHPYEWCWSLILNGGYTHEFAMLQPDGTLGPRERRTFKPGDINFMPHSLFHRIDVVKPDTYTQIFFGPAQGGRLIQYWTPEGLMDLKKFEAWRGVTRAGGGPAETPQ